MTIKGALNRAKGCLVGLAVGDALGSTLEFSRRDSLPKIVDMRGMGPFNLNPGEWTDDTSMALCLADSLLMCRRFDPHDVMQTFVQWYKEGYNSVNKRGCFDIGITTRQALDRYILTQDAGRWVAGKTDEGKAGNGTIMRLAPVSIAYSFLDDAVAIAADQSFLTHPSLEAATCAKVAAEIMHYGIDTGLRHPTVDLYSAGKVRKDISSSGYSKHTLEAALWAIHQTASFEDAVILAVNLGDDSDTVGAVTGQMAGSIYGLDAIPKRWLDKLADRDRIERIAEQLHALRLTKA